MNNKLKNGIILFIFLVVFGFIITNPFGLYSDFKGAYGVIYILFIAIFLTAIFLISLHKTEKKIAENKYNFRWLLKYNLIISLILYLAGFILSIILVYISVTFFGTEAESGLLVFYVFIYGLIVAPSIALVFSAVPSLIFYKFRSRQKILDILSLMFVFLIFVGIAFYSIDIVTCNFYNNYICLAKKAIENKDSSICGKKNNAFETIFGSSGGANRALCYFYTSRESTDIKICNNIKWESGEYWEDRKNQCITNIAINKNNSNICEEIGNDGTAVFNKETCYLRFKDGIKY